MKPVIGKSYLTEIPHEGKTITFQHPAFTGHFGNVAEQIDGEGLERSSSAKTASLVHDAFQNTQGKYESEIINLLESALFLEFEGNLYLPKSNEDINNGVILETNPPITNKRLAMDRKSLIERLQVNDPLVRFVPFGYKTGVQTWQELEKNPYIVARYKEEGAQKIAKVASKFDRDPKLWSFNSVEKEKVKFSYLNSNGGQLHVDGNNLDDYGNGFCLGVCALEKRK